MLVITIKKLYSCENWENWENLLHNISVQKAGFF